MMFVVTYRRVTEQAIVVDASDEEAARNRVTTDPPTCQYCGSEPLEPDIIINVEPA